ncbi:MAG: hypothetical protein AAF433_22250 [Bacteroidota bacterium]
MYPISGLLLPLFLIILSCQPVTSPPDGNAERAKILELHHAQRDHHFNADATSFVSQFSSQYRSVNRGEVQQPSSAESEALFQPYFESVDFIAWDDQTAPIIEFSADYSMAYSIVQKEVILAYPLDDGSSYVDTTYYAWTTIYRKYADEWRVDCVTSTTVPKN